MNTAIEMHDSQLLAVEPGNSGAGSILLRAYVHRTPGEPGVDAGEGGVQLIRIRIADMTIAGEVGELPSYLYDGSLAVDTAIQDNIVPFPATHSEPIRLSMTFAEDARVLTLSGSSAAIAPEGEFQYVERFKP